MIEVTINGELREIQEDEPVSTLLDRLGVPIGIAIVERNGEVVPKDHFETEHLGPGDQIEIVRLMGGG